MVTKAKAASVIDCKNYIWVADALRDWHWKSYGAYFTTVEGTVVAVRGPHNFIDGLPYLFELQHALPVSKHYESNEHSVQSGRYDVLVFPIIFLILKMNKNFRKNIII